MEVGDRTGGHRPGVFSNAIRQVDYLRPDLVISIGDLTEGKTEDLAQLNREWNEIDGLTEEIWESGINTHLRPLAILVRDLLPDFEKNRDSAVIGIASINATLGNAANPVYSAAKGGMLAMVRSYADRLARIGTRINSV